MHMARDMARFSSRVVLVLACNPAELTEPGLVASAAEFDFLQIRSLNTNFNFGHQVERKATSSQQTKATFCILPGTSQNQ